MKGQLFQDWNGHNENSEMFNIYMSSNYVSVFYII